MTFQAVPTTTSAGGFGAAGGGSIGFFSSGFGSAGLGGVFAGGFAPNGFAGCAPEGSAGAFWPAAGFGLTSKGFVPCCETNEGRTKIGGAAFASLRVIAIRSRQVVIRRIIALEESD
jgi:hypothetical protein